MITIPLLNFRKHVLVPVFCRFHSMAETCDSLSEAIISTDVQNEVIAPTELEPVAKKPRKSTTDVADTENLNKTTSLSSFKQKRFGKKETTTHRNLLNTYSKLKQQTEQFCENETQYYFENGFRKVYPYYYTFHTFCKGRWLGKSIGDVFCKEFRYYPREHFEKARVNGDLLINLKPFESLEVQLKNNDLLTHKIHRHEADVLDSEIKILCDDSKFLVVDKPSSIPIHPTGRYRNNTLCYILKKDFGYKNLMSCHRLDRLTSGIVIFAKTKYIANKVIAEIRNREVEKEYLCKVVGEFPATDNVEGIICNQPVCIFDKKLGISAAWKVDGIESKDALTHFYRISTDGKTSVVLCKPKTGRTHQIRIHLQYLGFPIVNDPMYNHDAWGEERFCLGPCTRNESDVALALSRTHHDPGFEPDSAINRNPIAQANNTMEQSKTNSKSSTNDVISTERNLENPYFSSNCIECQNPLPEPKVSWMIMYLHAYRYKGSDWEFQTTLPEWAQTESNKLLINKQLT